MHLRLFILLFASLAFAGGLVAQDVHYTLHNYAPLQLNPANTGAFSGSVRVGGVYRGQWYSLNGINTPTAYADAPLAFGFRKQDWIGVGALLIADRAGDFNLSSTFFGMSAAYHLALDKKRRNVLTIGAQYGSTSYGLQMPDDIPNQQRIIDPSLGGGGTSPEMIGQPNVGGPNSGNNNNDSYNDINAGVRLKLLLDAKKQNIFTAGVSLLHLATPDRRSLVMVAPRDTTMGPINSPGRGARERRRTLHAHTRLDLEMNDKWRFQPTAFYQASAGTSSLQVQAWGQRNLKKDLDMRIGLGYRTGDAAQVLFGFDTDRLRAALSYDVTVSQARNIDSYQGAFELGVAYIFNIYKKPTVVPTILCPDL